LSTISSLISNLKILLYTIKYKIIMEIEELFDTLLSKPAEPPNSIDLSFIDQIDLKNLFEFLLSFFTEISKTFYGDDNHVVKLENLSDTDFKRINAYIESIGFTTILKTFDIDKTAIFNIGRLQNGKYNKINITCNTKLSDLYFTLKSDNIIYKISFDIYQENNQLN
jgi:hypothetical protein